MDSVKYIRATSKRALKDSCLFVAKGDYVKAGELYDYYSKDINLPDFDAEPVGTFTQVKDTTANVFSWIKDNKDEIITWVDFFRGMKKSTKDTVDGASVLPKI